jgi:hypothetical protein
MYTYDNIFLYQQQFSVKNLTEFLLIERWKARAALFLHAEFQHWAAMSVPRGLPEAWHPGERLRRRDQGCLF